MPAHAMLICTLLTNLRPRAESTVNVAQEHW